MVRDRTHNGVRKFDESLVASFDIPKIKKEEKGTYNFDFDFSFYYKFFSIQSSLF